MKKLLTSFLIVLSSTVYAGCQQNYPKELSIVVPNTVELCSSFYVSIYDTNHKSVVFVSEKLSKDSTVGSATRVNAFQRDRRVGKDGATNSDYIGSGFDRGHMAPAADASDSAQMKETFLLTNMTPQEPTLNRNAWKKLEERVRKIRQTRNEDMWVLNIAIYPNEPKYIGNSIPVPSGYWKIVYTKDANFYYYVDNKPYATVLSVSAVDVNKLLGIK